MSRDKPILLFYDRQVPDNRQNQFEFVLFCHNNNDHEEKQHPICILNILLVNVNFK